MESTGKNPSKHSPFHSLWSWLKRESDEVSVVLIYGLAVGVLTLTVPVGVQTVVNTAAFTRFAQPVYFLSLAVFAGLAISAVFRMLQTWVIERLQRRLFVHLALELAVRLPRTKSYGEGRLPELVNRFFDVVTIQKSVALLLLEGFGLALQTFFGLLLLAFYHPVLLAFDILVVGGVVVTLFVLGRGAVRSAIEKSVQKYRVAAWLEEIAGLRVTFSTEEARQFALKRADKVVLDYLQARQSHFTILFRQTSVLLGIQAVASGLLLALGIFLISRNQLSVGQLVAAEIVVSTVLFGLTKLHKHLEAFYDLGASLDKIDHLLAVEQEPTGEVLPDREGPLHVELREVGYRYGEDRSLLETLSMTLQPGMRLALKGHNGSGKSTLMDLLYGLRHPTSGYLLVDAVDSRLLGPESLRKHVALVRGREMFEGTLLDNLCAGVEHPVDEVRKVLSQLGVLEDILRTKEGLMTRVSASGAPLSVAQAQIVVLARAVLRRPRLLLIDEALDHLDPVSRKRALNLVFDRAQPWTLLITTHNADIEGLCDEVIDLSSGTGRRAA